MASLASVAPEFVAEVVPAEKHAEELEFIIRIDQQQ
jgi:hypothetical protein